MLGRDARAARGRDDQTPARAAGGGPQADRSRDPRPALVAPARAGRAGRRARRAARGAARPPRQVPGVAAVRRRSSRTAPAHDRVRPVRPRPRAAAHPRAHRAGAAAGRASATRARRRAATWGGGVGGRRLAIVDPRRFGTGELLLGAQALEAFFAARLGLEPFDERFTPEHLRALARGRNAPIKALLLDQRRIAGVGNIYADEALFRSRRPPAAPGRDGSRASSTPACARRSSQVLCAGIDARGATIDDFRHVDGVRGSFQDRFLVHRRAGEPCPRCETHDREDGRRGPRHLRVRDLPAAAAATSRPAGMVVAQRRSGGRAARPGARSRRPPAAR